MFFLTSKTRKLFTAQEPINLFRIIRLHRRVGGRVFSIIMLLLGVGTDQKNGFGFGRFGN